MNYVATFYSEDGTVIDACAYVETTEEEAEKLMIDYALEIDAYKFKLSEADGQNRSYYMSFTVAVNWPYGADSTAMDLAVKYAIAKEMYARDIEAQIKNALSVVLFRQFHWKVLAAYYDATGPMAEVEVH